MRSTGEGRERPLPLITRLYHVRKSSNLSPEMQEMVRSPLRRSLWGKASHGNEPIKHVFHHSPSPSRRICPLRCNTREKVTKWPTFPPHPQSLRASGNLCQSLYRRLYCTKLRVGGPNVRVTIIQSTSSVSAPPEDSNPETALVGARRSALPSLGREKIVVEVGWLDRKVEARRLINIVER